MLFDIQSFNFTYLFPVDSLLKQNKQMTNVIWNLAPKELKLYNNRNNIKYPYS